MSSFLNRLLNIRPDEGRKVFMLVLIFFLFITGTTWAETIIESSFYFLAGVSRLSQVFTFHAITAIISTAVYTAFVDQTSNQKLLVAVCATASVAIGLGLLVLGFNQILAYVILYVLVRAVRTSFLIQWWNYASDFYDARASKRIIPVINSASRVAIIFAGLTIPLLDKFLSPTAIILLWVATLLLIAILSFFMNRITVADNAIHTNNVNAPKQNREHISYWHNIREGFQYVSSSNYLRWLALSTFLMVVIFGILNYQGGLIFSQQFKTRSDMTDFIGNLNGLTSLVMLPVQLFLFSRIVTKLGVGNANVIYPFGTLLISGSMLFAPASLTSGALAHFDRNTFRYSTQESSNNLLYNAVPARVKGRSRSFIDGLVLPVALLASSALLEIGKALPANLFLPILLGIPALAYLVCSLVIRNMYSNAMLKVLEQEDYTALFPANDEIALTADPTAKNILLKKLVESKDDNVILLIAQIMSETAGNSVLPILEMKARESSIALRAGIVDVIATVEAHSFSKTSLVHFYTAFLQDPDEHVRRAAFSGLLRSAETDSQDFLDQAARLLEDESYEIRSQALSGLLGSTNPTYRKTGETALEALLDQADPRARICALSALGRTSEPRYFHTILNHIDESEDQVRLQAVKALDLRSPEGFPPEIIPAILNCAESLSKDPLDHVKLAALNILQKTRSPQAPQLIVDYLLDSDSQVQETAAAILLRSGETAVPAVLDFIERHKDWPASQSIAKAVLCRIDLKKYGGLADEQIRMELKDIYTRNWQLSALENLPASGPGLLMLRGFLGEQNRSSLKAIFTLLSARHGDKALERISSSLAAQSSHTRANASEALEALISPSQVKLIMPLFDNAISIHELARMGANVWSEIKIPSQAKIFYGLAVDLQNELTRGLAIYALGELIPVLPSPEAPPVENRIKRRMNLLDKLIDETPAIGRDTPRQGAGTPLPENGIQMISQPEARYLIALAQNDISHAVRSAALAAARLAGKTSNTMEGEFMTASLSVIERIIFLKQVTLFQSMTIEQLKVMASICEDETISQGTVIFKEGDPGGAVYVVVHGRIGIQREGDRKGSVVRLATLEARGSFGEMNMFDNSPRSANAVAIEDALLLKLRSEPFMAIIHQHPDMSLELIKVLSIRIREANDQIAHLTRSTPHQLQKLYDRLETTDGNPGSAN